MAVIPARILGLEPCGLTVGKVADLTVLAPDAATEISASTFRSLGHNTPFDGWNLRGSVAATIVAGRTVYANANVQGASAFEHC